MGRRDMIKLVAFDRNGTLFADTAASWKAGNQELLHFGHEPVGLTRFRQTFAIPISEYWLVNGGTKRELLLMKKNHNKIFNDFYEPIAKKLRTRSGVRPLL